MKIGFRIPNLNKRIAARTSLKRVIRHNLGFKAPRGMGWMTNPKRAMYNKVYNKTSRGCMLGLLLLISTPLIMAYLVYKFAWHNALLRTKHLYDYSIVNKRIHTQCCTK